MFMFHAALALGLIALTMATALCVWSKQPENIGTGFAKIIAIIVIILAAISTICTLYCGVKCWYLGECTTMMGTHPTIAMDKAATTTPVGN
jgi:hypothetical protein